MPDYADPRKHASPRSKFAAGAMLGSIMLAFILSAVGFSAIFGLGMAYAFTPLLGWLAGLLLAVFFVIAGRCLAVARRRRAAVLLSYVDQAVRLKLPLPQMLLASSRGENPLIAAQLQKLTALVEDGTPIGDALAIAAPHTPARVVELATVAQRNGTLATTLPRLLRDERALARRDPASAALGRVYAAILACGLTFVIGALAIFVMPKFEQIFKDFGIRLPQITLDVLGTARVLMPLVLAIAGLALAWMMGRGMRDALVVRPLALPLNDLLDRVVWYTPLAGALARDRGLADVCHVLADALDVGRPLDAAIVEADRPHLNVVLRTRLAVWASGIASGAAPSDAARDAAMPAIVVGLLSSAASGGGAIQVFQFLARYYESRFHRGAMLVRSAVVPAMALVAGAITLVTALAFVLPIVRLIDVTNPYPQVQL